MRPTSLLLGPALIGLALAAPAAAHHSLVAYDHDRSVTLEGVVREFHFTQPHPYLTLAVAADVWRLELDNLWELQEIGMTRDSFRPADKVRVSGMPDRYGGKAMYLRSLDRSADGFRYEQVGSRPAIHTRPRS